MSAPYRQALVNRKQLDKNLRLYGFIENTRDLKKRAFTIYQASPDENGDDHFVIGQALLEPYSSPPTGYEITGPANKAITPITYQEASKFGSTTDAVIEFLNEFKTMKELDHYIGHSVRPKKGGVGYSQRVS